MFPRVHRHRLVDEPLTFGPMTVPHSVSVWPPRWNKPGLKLIVVVRALTQTFGCMDANGKDA